MSEDLEQLKRDYKLSQPRVMCPGLETYIPILSERTTGKDIPERKYLLGDWLPVDSFGTVYADRGVGKSWFCMALCRGSERR